MGEVGNACDAGTGCGGCRPEIASIVESEQVATRAYAAVTRLPVLQAS